MVPGGEAERRRCPSAIFRSCRRCAPRCSGTRSASACCPRTSPTPTRRISSRAIWSSRNSTRPAPAAGSMGSLAMMRTSDRAYRSGGRWRTKLRSEPQGGFPDQARRQCRQSRRRNAQGFRQPDGLRGGDLALQQEPASSEDRDRQGLRPDKDLRERHHGKRWRRFRPLDEHRDLGPARAGGADAGDLGKYRERGFHGVDRRRRSLSPQGPDVFLRTRPHAGCEGGDARQDPARSSPRFASSTSPAIRRPMPPATSNIPTSIR